MNTGLRTRLLTLLGGSWPVIVWARIKSRRTGVSLRRVGSALELRRQDRAVLLGAKHSFFAPRVCAAFHAFDHALPTATTGGVSTVDFEAEPDAFNLSRRCLEQGAWLEYRENKAWLRKDSRAVILSDRHLIYAPHLAEHFDNYVSELIPTIRDGIEVLDYSKPGILQTYRNSGLQFEMASFPEEGAAIEDYFRWYKLKSGDLVFDIGAHCGVSTYHFSQLVGPEGTVVCFEPDPANFELLQRNIERHNLTNVRVEKVAIAGERGRLLFSAETTVGSMLGSLLQRETAGEMVEVEAWKLEDAFEKYGVPQLCKLDIEGAELEVIASSGDLLRKHRTNFAIDTNHAKPNGQLTTRDVEASLRSYGYDVLSEANPFVTTWARPGAR